LDGKENSLLLLFKLKKVFRTLKAKRSFLKGMGITLIMALLIFRVIIVVKGTWNSKMMHDIKNGNLLRLP